jgi:hypothetical protein
MSDGTKIEVRQRVVCAAIRKEGRIICGPRHFDSIMHATMTSSERETKFWIDADQGFVDQRGNYLSRTEAHGVAVSRGQVIRWVGGDDIELFSENLY